MARIIVMYYTRTVMITGSKFGEEYSTKDNLYHSKFKLPIDLDERLGEEINRIYSDSKTEIVNMTITPTIAFFDIFPIPVIYTIVYVYK